jgi:hypothetical protein
MKTKNIVIISSLIIASLLLGLFWVVAPANMKDKVVGLISFASADRLCFNYYKNEKDYFKDPDSAYIESSRILTKKDDKEELRQYPVVLKEEEYDSVVQIKVRAHNSMGGYVSDNIYCPLNNVIPFIRFISFSASQLFYSIDEGRYNDDAYIKKTCTAETKTASIEEFCLQHPEGW